MSAELLPCPFCGGDAELWAPYSYDHVYCVRCGVRTADRIGEDYATTDWNRRVQQPAQASGDIAERARELLAAACGLPVTPASFAGTLPSGVLAQTALRAIAVALRDCPACGGSGHVDDAQQTIAQRWMDAGHELCVITECVGIDDENPRKSLDGVISYFQQLDRDPLFQQPSAQEPLTYVTNCNKGDDCRSWYSCRKDRYLKPETPIYAAPTLRPVNDDDVTAAFRELRNAGMTQFRWSDNGMRPAVVTILESFRSRLMGGGE